MMMTLLLAGILGMSDPTGAGDLPPRPINSFATEAELQSLKANNTTFEPQPIPGTSDRNALRITFHPAQWPNITFNPAPSWDWKGYGGLALEVKNPSAEALTFHIRIDDDVKADGNLHSRTGSGTIEPGKTATYVVQFGPDPMSVGMRGLPSQPGMRPMGASGSGPFNFSHIVSMQIFMHLPNADKTLIVDNLRLVPPVSLQGIVDPYGQYAKADWPGKLHALSDFAARKKEEAAWLETHPILPERDRYGGWTKGPQLEKTGYFRTAKVEGKWWFVDPDGRLFLSFGPDEVAMNVRTFTAGRESMFAWIPKPDDPLHACVGYQTNIHSGPVKEGADISFLVANLMRKFGPDYQKAYYDETLKRLPAWGFNTLGNWSDQRLYGNGHIAYVATAGIGGNHARISSGSDYWGKMHDPFDPQFATDVESSLRDITQKVKGDPWCLGYFVDNELSWAGEGEDNGRYGLAYGALQAPVTSPAKQAFLTQLKAKYPQVTDLNAAWGTAFADWSALDPPTRLQGKLNAAQRADMSAFLLSFARKYFTVIHDVLKREDPDHLYFGCRFAWHMPEAVQAASEICDVVSFNIYQPNIHGKEWDSMVDLNKPCIIGEFHFGALDRGMFHPGLVSTPNQAARAQMYQDYVRSVVDNPAFVGCHWFEYLDEPLTGRVWDGENYNIGFVTVTDTPYPEMVTAALQVHAEAYSRRYGHTSAAAP